MPPNWPSASQHSKNNCSPRRSRFGPNRWSGENIAMGEHTAYSLQRRVDRLETRLSVSPPQCHPMLTLLRDKPVLPLVAAGMSPDPWQGKLLRSAAATVVRWLIAHPDVPPAHHGAIIDYLHAQKFVPSMEGLGRGHPRLVPPRPHLCMKGRDPAVLLRDVEQW